MADDDEFGEVAGSMFYFDLLLHFPHFWKHRSIAVVFRAVCICLPYISEIQSSRLFPQKKNLSPAMRMADFQYTSSLFLAIFLQLR